MTCTHPRPHSTLNRATVNENYRKKTTLKSQTKRERVGFAHVWNSATMPILRARHAIISEVHVSVSSVVQVHIYSTTRDSKHMQRRESRARSEQESGGTCMCNMTLKNNRQSAIAVASWLNFRVVWTHRVETRQTSERGGGERCAVWQQQWEGEEEDMENSAHTQQWTLTESLSFKLIFDRVVVVSTVSLSSR